MRFLINGIRVFSIVLVFFALMAFVGFAGEIRSIRTLVNDDQIGLSLESDSAFAFDKRLDFSEWKMYFLFPGFSLALPPNELRQSFPEKYRDFVDSFYLESNPEGSQLVLVLGRNAVPLRIRASASENSFTVLIPTSKADETEKITVHLGYLDPPAKFLELSPTGKAYRLKATPMVLQSAEPTKDSTKGVEITAQLPPVVSTRTDSYLLPEKGIGSKESVLPVEAEEKSPAKSEAKKSFRRDFRIPDGSEGTSSFSHKDFLLKKANGTAEAKEKPASPRKPSWKIEGATGSGSKYTFETFKPKKSALAASEASNDGEEQQAQAETPPAASEESASDKEQAVSEELAKEEPAVAEAKSASGESSPTASSEEESPIKSLLTKEELEAIAKKAGAEVVVSTAGEEKKVEQVRENSPTELTTESKGQETSELEAMGAGSSPESPKEQKRVEGGHPWDVKKPRLAPLPEGPKPPELEMLESERITYETTDAPLKEAIALMVASTTYNVIVDQEVGDLRVTLSFRNEPLKSALDAICAAKDIMYHVVGKTIVVGKRDDIGRRLGGFVTRTFTLNYADAEDVKKVLIDSGLVGEKNISVYYGEKKGTDFVDRSTVLSEAEGGVAAGQIRPLTGFLSTAKPNVVLVTETPERMQRIEQVIRELDRKPKVVTLETSIVELSETGLKELGVAMDKEVSIGISEEHSIKEAAPGDTEAPPPGAIALGMWVQTIFRDPISFMTTISTLIQQGEARILSRPNITAVDGSQAIYFAGTLVPFIKRPAIQTGTTFTPAQVDFQPVGITLSFKPRVDENDSITLVVNPMVSTLISFVDLGGGARAPQTQTRQITTTVRVKNRETFIIAGMLSETERETLQRVPLLGEIPLFEKIFSKTTRDKERTEIVVFVTPVLRED